MSPPLRVLHVTRDFPPKNNGGLSTAVGGLVDALARAGTECVVVSFDGLRYGAGSGSVQKEPARSTSEGGTTVIHVAGKAAVKRAEELANNFQGDIVHVHHESLWGFGKTVAHFNQVPTVFTVHVLQSEQNRLRKIKSTASSEAQNLALAQCDLIHAPSQAVADLLLKGTATLGSRLKVAPLGLGDWPKATAASERERFTSNWVPHLLYVGRFADINGFQQFLEALPTIFAAHPTLRATAAGGMPDNPRSEKRWKKRWGNIVEEAMAGNAISASAISASVISSDELEARLHWAGWQGQSELSDLYAQATMLVVPSWFETFGQVAREGMLHGTPLIATKAGALALVVDERSALRIQVQSSDSIAHAVSELLANPKRAEERRTRARKTMLEGQHWDDRVSQLIALYESTLRS